MAGHVHRNTVDANLKVSSVIGIEATEKNLIRLASAMMLANNQARYQPHDVAGRVRRAKLKILRPSGLFRRRRCRLLAPRVNLNRIGFAAAGDQARKPKKQPLQR